MKYYVVEVTNNGQLLKGEKDGKVIEYGGVSINGYDTLNDAIASFHGKLSTNMKSNLCETELVMVIDEDGAVYKSEKVVGKYVEYVEPIAEEKPIEEEVEEVAE